MALEALQGKRLEEFARFIKLAFDKTYHKWKENYQIKSGVSLYKMTVQELIQNNILKFNFAEYAKFEALLPHITWFENGSHQIIIKRYYSLDSDEENMKFCLKFFLTAVIDFKKEVDI